MYDAYVEANFTDVSSSKWKTIISFTHFRFEEVLNLIKLINLINLIIVIKENINWPAIFPL